MIEETLSASDSEGTLEEAIVNESQENATIEEKEDENITPVEEQKIPKHYQLKKQT